MDLNKTTLKKIIFIIAVGILIYTAVGHGYGLQRNKMGCCPVVPLLLGMVWLLYSMFPCAPSKTAFSATIAESSPKLIQNTPPSKAVMDAYFYFRYYLHCYPVYSPAAHHIPIIRCLRILNRTQK